MVLDYPDALSKTDFPALLAFYAFAYIGVSTSFSMQLPQWYKLAQMAPRGSPFRVWGLPPAWVFGLVWIVLYFLIATAGYIYYIDLNSTLSANYVGVLFLVLVSIVLTKFWAPVFFGAAGNPNVMTFMFQLAWVVVLAIFGTALAANVMFAIDAEWWSFILWLPYTLWTAYAFVLQIQFAIIGSRFFSVEAVNTYFALVKQHELEHARRQQTSAINMGATTALMSPMYGQQQQPYSGQQQPGGFGTFSSASYHSE